MTPLEALKARHSIRKYKAEPLTQADVAALRQEIVRLNGVGGLRMQLVLDEPKAFKSFLAYGKFTNVSNYVMVVGKKSETFEYRAGYYAEQLVLFAQAMGLGTCFVGLTYKKVNGAFDVAADEKIAFCIAIGYPAEEGRVHKSKRPDQVSNVGPDTPAWFAAGVEAALLAPTAINQQKFRFEYVAPDGVRPTRGTSLVGYTKIDLGIAMRNFEIGAAPALFTWLDSPL